MSDKTGAARGLAGLVGRWRIEIGKCCPVLLKDANSNFADASCRQQLRDVEELEAEIAALEAAAPSSTGFVVSGEPLSEAESRWLKASAAALATPSPQAPPQEELYCPACGSCVFDGHDKTCPDPRGFTVKRAGSPRKVGEDGPDERIWCMECGKSVSTPVPKDTIVRAWVQCPECIEKGKGLCNSQTQK